MIWSPGSLPSRMGGGWEVSKPIILACTELANSTRTRSEATHARKRRRSTLRGLREVPGESGHGLLRPLHFQEGDSRARGDSAQEPLAGTCGRLHVQRPVHLGIGRRPKALPAAVDGTGGLGFWILEPDGVAVWQVATWRVDEVACRRDCRRTRALSRLLVEANQRRV